nr:MMPL family transporter [Oculatella sp. LEGE 06141]
MSLALTPQLESALTGTGVVYQDGEAYQVERVLQQELGISPETLTVIFTSPQAQNLTEAQADIDCVIEQIRTLATVETASSPIEPGYLSSDGNTAYSVISLHGDERDRSLVIDRIEHVLDENQIPTVTTYLAGEPVFDRDAQTISKADLARAEFITLPLTLIALLFVFGSAIAAALPVAMGIMTVSVTLGLLAFIAAITDVSIFAINITTMLGLGIGIDFSLLMVNRFREELRSGSVEDAVVRTADTAGRAVFFSGLTTCIGLVSLLLFPIVLLRSLGLAGSLVVFMSIAAALTLVPALLGLLGTGVNRWRVVRPAPERDGLWAAIAHTIMRHSLVATAVVFVIIGLLASPFLSAQFGLGEADILPAQVQSRQGIEMMKQAFGEGEPTPVVLVIRTTEPGDTILSAQHIETLYGLVEQLEADPRVAAVKSLVNIDPRLNLENYQQIYSNPAQVSLPDWAVLIDRLSNETTTVVTVTSQTNSNAEETRGLVHELRDRSIDQLQLQVGGQTARAIDTMQVIFQRFPWVLAAIMFVTFVALTVLFGSVVLPLKAIFLNLMSIAASFGALVFIFQNGNFQTWLNFTPLGYLDIMLPVVLFCVLFGLSMDYEVFLLTRIKEAYDESGNNRRSVAEGLERTGRIITSAALLMIIVTGAFALTSIIFVKALGLGIAIAVLIDSTLVRAVLAPASMNLMGKWNWWSPKFLRLERVSTKLD